MANKNDPELWQKRLLYEASLYHIIIGETNEKLGRGILKLFTCDDSLKSQAIDGKQCTNKKLKTSPSF